MPFLPPTGTAATHPSTLSGTCPSPGQVTRHHRWEGSSQGLCFAGGPLRAMSTDPRTPQPELGLELLLQRLSLAQSRKRLPSNLPRGVLPWGRGALQEVPQPTRDGDITTPIMVWLQQHQGASPISAPLPPRPGSGSGGAESAPACCGLVQELWRLEEARTEPAPVSRKAGSSNSSCSPWG